MVALAGAGPWPQITSVLPRLTSWTMIGTSPPGPLRCGSTTCSVKAIATPASNALPPLSRVAIPTAVAIQWVEVTTPNVPSISGRVVNGSGLILLAISDPSFRRAHLTTVATGCQQASPPAALLSASSCLGTGRVDRVAGDAVDQFGRLLAAEIEGERTARIEGAAFRRIDRVGDLAPDRNPLSAGHRKIRHCAEQHFCVGHARPAEEFATLCDLGNTAEIHHADPVRHVAHDGEVVADEEVGQAESVLQIAHQIEDLRLHGDVERRSWLVANDELGFGGERARD